MPDKQPNSPALKKESSEGKNMLKQASGHAPKVCCNSINLYRILLLILHIIGLNTTELRTINYPDTQLYYVFTFKGQIVYIHIHITNISK